MGRPSYPAEEPFPILPRLRVAAAALLFSTGGVAVKATALSSWQVASLRSGVAALVVLAALGLRPAWRPRLRWSTWLVALAYAATLTLYVAANKLTTAASAIFLQSTAPLYVLLLSPLLLREAARRRDLLHMALLAFGLGLFFLGTDPASATAPDPFTGNLLGALSGLTWALTLLGLRAFSRDGGGAGGLGAVLCGNLLAWIAVLPAALPLGSPAPSDWLAVVYLGAFQVAGAYFFLTAGMRRLGALEASLLLLLDPVLAPLWAWLAFGEIPGLWTVAGGALILAATTARAWLEERRAPLIR